MQLPADQEAVRAKCFHPEESIPERFEAIVRQYPKRLVVQTDKHAFTYDELNKTAESHE